MPDGKLALVEEKSPAPAAKSRVRGRPPSLGDRARRLTIRLRGDEYDALVAFAKERYWEKSVALRLILRERLFGEKLPF